MIFCKGISSFIGFDEDRSYFHSSSFPSFSIPEEGHDLVRWGVSRTLPFSTTSREKSSLRFENQITRRIIFMKLHLCPINYR